MVRVAGRVALAAAVLALASSGALGEGVSVLERSPTELRVRLEGSRPGELCRVTYDDGKHRFVWENLSPDASGAVRLADDKHLRPEFRLQCQSRTHPTDPVVFDDLLKGAVVGKSRLPLGVPVSTFGGAGYLVPGLSDLKRDDLGNFWLYLAHPPHAILKYGPDFDYRFALLLPEAPVAHDVDGEGNLYILHPGNWVSKHGPLGEDGGAWELPRGRDPGEFIEASGMTIDRKGGWIYLADETLGRVQRFDLDLRLRPFPQIAWGWIGREDLAYTRAGEYDRELMYYQLDRPRQLALDGRGNLLVSCEHWISRFDLATGRQMPFGSNPVLGWGGTFTDSPFSASAALDGHWQRHWLAGVDRRGNIYLADRGNEFVVDPRIQVFDAKGVPLKTFDLEDELRDASGRRVYVTAVKGLAAGEEAIWMVEAGGRVYESPSGEGLVGGGRLFLGPGAAGRQFDLSGAAEANFAVEVQGAWVKHLFEGRVLGWPAERSGTANCEREGSGAVREGERSMWIPARLGEPFGVALFDSEDRLISAGEYVVEFEEKPGLFGTQYDYFRVTNRSGRTWRDVRFVAESLNLK